MPTSNRQWWLTVALFFVLQTGTLAWLRPEPGPSLDSRARDVAIAARRIDQLTARLDELSKRLEPALDLVFEQEGGYVRDPHDPGGETNFGISKRAHPEIDIRNLTRDKAAEVYRKRYWLPVYDRFKSPEVAAKVFSLAVNMGSRPAHRCLQRAIRGAGQPPVAVDGVIGPVTLAATDRADPAMLIASLRSEAACFYRSLGKPRYLRGWENRAYQ